MFHHGIQRLFTVTAIAALATLASCKDAQAAWGLVHSWYNEDSDRVVIVAEDDSDGSLWWFEFDADDNVVVAQYLGEDNPNPDDGTTTPGDKESWEALLKQRGGGGLQTNFQKTPIGKYLNGKGKGLGPLHNPGDDGDSGGVSPADSTRFKDPFEDLQEIGGEGHLGDAGGIDGNGGPISSQLEDLGRKKGTNGDNSEGTSSGKPEDGGLWGPEMPGPPELVNPNPARGADKAFVLIPIPGTGWYSGDGDTTTKSLFTGRRAAVGPTWTPSNIGPAAVNFRAMQSTGLQSMGAGMSRAGISAAPATNVLRAVR